MAPKKSVITDAENVVSEVQAEAAKVVAEVGQELHKVEADLAGKTTQELKLLHDEALAIEDKLKRELYVLRQRAANLATTAEADIEAEIVALKKKIVKAASRIREIESCLAGELKDIWGTRF